MQQFDSKILIVKKETHDVKTLRLETPNEFDFKPGQYIILTIGQNLVKDLSISSSPTKDGYIEVSKKITESDFSKKFDSLKEGDIIKVHGPMGGFVFEEELKSAVMLCGGIGITPLRNMIQFATDKKLKCKITLFYSNKTEGDIAFFEELKELDHINPNLKIIFTITRPNDSKNEWHGEVGRIDQKLVINHVNDLNEPIFFICGPPSMVQAISDLLKSLKINEEKIRTELFTGYE